MFAINFYPNYNIKTMAIQLDVKQIRDLFIHRSDVYQYQKETGLFITKNEVITDALLQDHLDGSITLGTYQLNEHNTVKWTAVDIDVDSSEVDKPDFLYEDWENDLLAQADAIKREFLKYDIKAYSEFSGRRGIHVWIFFQEPVAAKLVKDLMAKILGTLTPIHPKINLEVYPRQTKIANNRLGTALKIPMAFHRVSRTMSFFYDNINAIDFVSKKKLENNVTPVDSMYLNCEALRNIRDISNNDANGLKHLHRLHLGNLLVTLDGGRDEVHNVIQHQNNYKQKTTDNHLDSLLEEDGSRVYGPTTCKTLQDLGVCPGPCANIGKAKSPIIFSKTISNKKTNTAKSSVSNKDANAVFRRLEVDGEEIIIKERTSLLRRNVGGESGYYLFEGYEKQAASYERISTVIFDITKEVTRIHGENKTKELHGILQCGNRSVPFIINADEYSRYDKLEAAITNAIGAYGVDIKLKQLFKTSINTFASPKQELIYENFGYDGPVDDPERYISKTCIIDKDGIHLNDTTAVDLSKIDYAKYLDIVPITDTAFENLKDHIKHELLEYSDRFSAHTGLAFTLLPTLFPWLVTPENRNKFALYVKGRSGRGKSHLYKSLQHFYGPSFKSYANWGDTPMSVQANGHYFKDALYYVDDLKPHLLGSQIGQAKNALQTYADGTGRSRLTPSGDSKASKPILGHLAVTAEDLISGEVSILGRMLIVDWNPPGTQNLDLGYKVTDSCKNYSGFTSRFIHHVLNISDKKAILDLQRSFNTDFYKLTLGKDNDMRLARNYALQLAAHSYVVDFLWPEEKRDDIKKWYKDELLITLDTQVKQIIAQKPSELYINTLKDMISSGKILIQANNNISDEEKKSKGLPVGFKDPNGGCFVNIILSKREVDKYLKSIGDAIQFTDTVIIDQLFDSGYLISKEPFIEKINGISIPLHKFNDNIL